MTSWNIKTLRALDLKFAEEGIHPHQRPFHAALEILGSDFSMCVGGNREAQRVMNAYAEMMPEAKQNWPGMGTGLAAVVDQVRRVIVPVVYGSVNLQPWQMLTFGSQDEWWHWCRENRDYAAQTAFAVADLFDLTYGISDMQGGSTAALTLWGMASSNLADAGNTLPHTNGVDSVLQPICMTVELSLKAALVANGADPNSFKGKDGHNLVKLMNDLASAKPHRDDDLARDAIARLPPYVASRYEPAGLNRLKVVRLAMAAQFVAASTIRRFTSRDMAADWETGDWPAPRRPFFPS